MEQIFSYVGELQQTLCDLPLEAIEKTISVIHQARLDSKLVFVMGNGGSAATASHFACDLGKNTRREGCSNFKVISLTDNLAFISALANDEGYENIFSGQLDGLVGKGDVVIGISASGNSRNVLNAIELANDRGATTIGFTGFTGGKLGSLVDINVHVNSNCIEQVEDIHLMLEHMICKILREKVEEIEIAKDMQAKPDLADQYPFSVRENVSISSEQALLFNRGGEE